MNKITAEQKFDAWRDSLPANHWAKYDLAACRLGWDAALAAERDQSPAVGHAAMVARLRELRDVIQEGMSLSMCMGYKLDAILSTEPAEPVE